jgi:hypothetical protein
MMEASLPAIGRKLTPSQLSRLWGVDYRKVISWIRSGELRATDGRGAGSSQPRFLIDTADVAAFEAARAVRGQQS